MTEYMQAFILTFIEAVCCTMFFGTFFEKRFIEEHRRAFTWVNKGLLGGDLPVIYGDFYSLWRKLYYKSNCGNDNHLCHYVVYVPWESITGIIFICSILWFCTIA